MSLLGLLEGGLFSLGQILRFPVMFLLWVCVIAVAIMAGACVMEFLNRRRERDSFDIKRWLSNTLVLQVEADKLNALPGSLGEFTQRVQQTRAEGELLAGALENLVLEFESALRRRLDPSRLLVKVAPSLGLLGTLIPMGVSLAAMASGNLEAMAGQMVVAFTTTIVGLACGTAAFVINLVRQNWVSAESREIRFIAERVLHEIERSDADELKPGL
jgi:biopolymer transport protein ExbB/TolQ